MGLAFNSAIKSTADTYKFTRENSTLPTKSSKIRFEKIILSKNDTPTKDLRGSLAITKDDRHKGWLHVIIFIGQLFNAMISGKTRVNINLCHCEVIIGVNEAAGKIGQLLLAHAIFDGIKTTSEDHKKDEVITSLVIYKPVDERIKNLMAKFAEQTSVNFKKAGLDPKAKDFKAKVKSQVNSFSLTKMFTSVFFPQVLKPIERVQSDIAYAAADLLRGDKLRDAKGNLNPYYCTSYLLALTQGTSLVAALEDEELDELKGKTRDEVASHLLQRIQAKRKGDLVADTYWDNEFMHLDAKATMSYAAADSFDKAAAAA